MSSQITRSLEPARSTCGPRWVTALVMLALGFLLLAMGRPIALPMDLFQFWFVTQSDSHGVTRPYSDEAQAALSVAASERMTQADTEPFERRTLKRIESVFESLDDGRMMQSTGTPLLYATTAMFSTDSFRTTSGIASVLTIMAYFVAVWLVARYLGQSSAMTLGIWLVVWLVFRPAMFDVAIGNVAGLQLAMLVGVVCFLADKRWVLAGVVAAYAGLFKPTAAYSVVTLTVFLVALGDWRATGRFVLGGLLGGVFAVGVTVWAFGTPAVWYDWVTLMLPQVAETSYSLEDGNCGLGILLSEWVGRRMTGPLTLTLFGPVLLLAFAAGRAVRREKTDLTTFDWLSWMTAGACVMVLVSPLTWQHYYVLLIPGLMAAASRRPGWAATATFGIAHLGVLGLLGFPAPSGWVSVALMSAGALVLLTVTVETRPLRQMTWVRRVFESHDNTAISHAT